MSASVFWVYHLTGNNVVRSAYKCLIATRQTLKLMILHFLHSMVNLIFVSDDSNIYLASIVAEHRLCLILPKPPMANLIPRKHNLLEKNNTCMYCHIFIHFLKLIEIFCPSRENLIFGIDQV